MPALRSWSFAQVALAAGTWVLGWLVLGVAIVVSWIYFQSSPFADAAIGAVSVGVSEVTLGVILAILFVPPIVTIATWLIIHRS